MGFQSFTELNVWKEGRAYRLRVAEIIKSFPAAEKFNSADQILRSSRSVCDNIAEGHGRYSFVEQIRFCVIARLSLSESYNQLITAYDSQYISHDLLTEMQQLFKRVEALLNGYISFLKKQSETQS